MMLWKKKPLNSRKQRQPDISGKIGQPALSSLIYNSFAPVRRFREWFNNVDNFMLAFFILASGAVILFIIQLVYPAYSITYQNLSFVKNKEYVSISTQSMLIFFLLIRMVFRNTWVRYRVKPTGNIMGG